MDERAHDGPTTVQAVAAIVAVIQEQAGADWRDNETLHAAEDSLYVAVLKSIADGTAEDPAAMAREALRVADLDFSRWYA
jgi:hypothetical protein